MWNGAAETLKPKPVARRATAVIASACEPVRPASAEAISSIFVVPVAP